METQNVKLILSKYNKTLPEYDASKLDKVKFDSEESYKKLSLIHSYKELIAAEREISRMIYPINLL